MKKPIYLDYMATTPVDPAVVEKMVGCLDMSGNFGNPASNTHSYGWAAAEAVALARQQVAQLLGAHSEQDIVWTSGATESNNLAIKGSALFYQRKGKHIISSQIEHKSVLDSLAYLESQGFEVTYLRPTADGIITPDQVRNAMRSDTILLTIAHANNEIGVIQPIHEFSRLAADQGVIFHVDAAQSVGKIPINLQQLPVDLLSVSAHKLYGPKGIGVLYVKRKPRIRLQPLIHGGGHEFGLRSGTLATHQIVGMGEACRLAQLTLADEMRQILSLRQRLWQGIQDLGGLHLNGSWLERVPGNLNVSFDRVEGEALLVGLRDLAVSSGAACNSATIEPSYVLRAIGLGNEQANSTVRFSIGRFTTEMDIDYAISHVREVVNRLRAISPMGEL